MSIKKMASIVTATVILAAFTVPPAEAGVGGCNGYFGVGGCSSGTTQAAAVPIVKARGSSSVLSDSLRWFLRADIVSYLKSLHQARTATPRSGVEAQDCRTGVGGC